MLNTRAKAGKYDIRSSWQNETFYIYQWEDNQDYELDETFKTLEDASQFVLEQLRIDAAREHCEVYS